MSTDINNSAYATLNTYAVLASSAITAVDATIITNGSYGSSPTATYTGPIAPLTPDTAHASDAQLELGTLISAIGAVPSPQPIVPVVSGPVTFVPGKYNVAGDLTFSPGTTITLDAENNSNAQFFFTASTAITFNTVTSITLINGASNLNVFWVAGTAITFAGTSPASIPGILIAGSAVTFAAASQILGRVYAKTAAISFSGISSVDGASFIVCYAKGTLILTKQGYVPIEDIKAGNKVVTKGKIINNKDVTIDSDLKIEPVMWISNFKVMCLNSKSRPICIKKNALGKNCPFKDLYVSPGHRLLLNGKMVLAKNMINGETIYQDNECDSVEYYHLECEHHSGVFANGVLAETYLDVDDNRRVFEKSAKLNCPKLRLKNASYAVRKFK
jgi:hypothetical protein